MEETTRVEIGNQKCSKEVGGDGRVQAGGRGETQQKAQVLGMLPGPRPACVRSSEGSRCPATFDFHCLALFARYPGLATDLFQEDVQKRK